MLTEILAGSIGAAVVSGIALVLNVIFNKKLRTPGDNMELGKNAINERNEMLAAYKADLAETKLALKDTDARLDDVEKEIDVMRSERSVMIDERSAVISWAYRAIAVIRRLGTDEDIPMPVPPGVKP